MELLFWFVILLIVIVILTFGLKKIIEPFTCNIELVIARYNEDLEWLKKKKFKYPTTIYNKGNNDNFYKPKGCKVIKLQNVGRESHSYLYHVVNNYDKLPKLTLFLPGSADDKRKIKWVNKVVNNIKKEAKTTFPAQEHGDIKKKFYNFELDNWESTHELNNKANSEKKLFPATIRPFGKWYEAHFDKNVKYSGYGGIFAVSDSHIKQYNKQYYNKLLNESGVSSNPEVGHYFERAWVAVFGITENAIFV
jgi:hypothetical protein